MPLNKDARECSFFQENFIFMNKENSEGQKIFRLTSIKRTRE
jgi:hypothetical protein